MLNILISLLMAGLALDLLYLYFAGGWIEPNKAIRVCELALLWCFVGLGIFKAVKEVRELK